MFSGAESVTECLWRFVGDLIDEFVRVEGGSPMRIKSLLKSFVVMSASAEVPRVVSAATREVYGRSDVDGIAASDGIGS